MISVKAGEAPAELRAAVLAMKRADKSIRKDINDRMRSTMNPVWRSEVAKGLGSGGRMEARMLNVGVRVAAGNPPALVAASSSRKVGRGLVPNVNAPGYEFGSHGTKVSKVTSKRGKTYERHTTRHLPAYRKSGRVVFPAAARVLPRMASYFVQSVVRAYLDAIETRS